MKVLKFINLIIFIGALNACSQVDTIEFTAQNSTDLSDNDSDGVINIRDKCPNSPLNAKIDSNGCEHWLADDNFEEFFIFFDINSSTIPVKIQKDLIDLSKYLKSNTDIYTVIEGHTSNTGSDDMNDKLQLQRSRAVKEFIMNEGVSVEQIYLAPQGDHSDRVTIDSKAADTINQRVYLSTHLLESKLTSQWEMLHPPAESDDAQKKQSEKE